MVFYYSLKCEEVSHTLVIRFNPARQKVEFYDAGESIEDTFSHSSYGEEWTLDSFDFKICNKVSISYYKHKLIEWYPATIINN
jgi:hypothetical protein